MKHSTEKLKDKVKEIFQKRKQKEMKKIREKI